MSFFKNFKKTFIIAEMSANHGHSLPTAKETMKKAKECGADAIKIQTYRADTITFKGDQDFYKVEGGTLWDGRTLYDLYQEAYTPWEWTEELINYAKELDILLFSSPFDESAVDHLEKYDVPLYKVASFEIVDLPLIEKIASLGKPMIISTGIAGEEDIHRALEACYKFNNYDVALLQCTSSYPAPLEEANLRTIPELSKKFRVSCSGLSDHTKGFLASVISVSLGAKIIEKHFILDKALGGPDCEFSMEPKEFKEMVDLIRETEIMLGREDGYLLEEKKAKARRFAPSLIVTKDLKEGDILNEENLKTLRPNVGMEPRFYPEVLGKKVKTSLKAGDGLKREDLS